MTAEAAEAGSGESPAHRAPMAAKLLDYLVRAIVSDPDAVEVSERAVPNGVRLILRVAPEDQGRVIGRGGRTADSLRTLVRVAGARENVEVSLEIEDSAR
jgi:predicted RNA-binding protein YlqC (UPF0109 family)